MAKVLVTEQYLEDIGDSIRSKLDVSTRYKPSQMAAAIETIIGGGVNVADNGKVVVNGELMLQTSRSVTANGTYDTTTNNEVVVNVEGGGGGETTLGTKTITANDTYRASDDGYDGYSSVTVDVQPNLGTKTVTDNGVFAATDDSLDGYSTFTVSVKKSDINWLEEVETYAGIATTYPTPVADDAVCVSSTGEDYLYDGSQWVLMWVELTYDETMEVLEAA